MIPVMHAICSNYFSKIFLAKFKIRYKPKKTGPFEQLTDKN